jgi:hypothetical protein
MAGGDAMYVIEELNCPFCTMDHEVAVLFPAYPSRTYKFTCPETNKEVGLHLTPGAKRTVERLSSGTVIATEVT